MIFIAELCQNHNGDFEILKDMIYAAKDSGATYAKIQNIFAENLSFRERFEKGVVENEIIKVIKRPYKEEFNRLKNLEISYRKNEEFISICRKAKIKPLTTAFTCDDISNLYKVGYKEIKIASYDCASYPLLKIAKNTFNKIYVSTGASYDSEIQKAATILSKSNFSFLHCVTIYPTPLDYFNLARMNYLRSFSNDVGWSDHSLATEENIKGTIAAIYYGANIIERHFTILPKDSTKDGPVSINPSQLKKIMEFSEYSEHDLKYYLEKDFPDYKKCFGTENRDLTNQELLNRDYYRGRFINHIKNKQVYNWDFNEDHI